MAKPVKRVDVSKLSPEQRAALAQFIRDCKQVAPQMEQLQRGAIATFLKTVKAPEWGIVEAPHEGEQPSQDLWHVGAPEVNYVDHIDTGRPFE